jgi:thiol-disulfide isomerase/thioredoxin
VRTFLFSVATALALAFWLNHVGKNRPSALALNVATPHAPLVLLGNPDSSADIRRLIKRTTVIDVMASWCEPCIKTIAPLEHLADSLGRDRFDILYVAYDEPNDTALLGTFFREARVARIPTVYVPDGTAFRERYFAFGIPRSYLVDSVSTLRWQDFSATMSGAGHALLDSAGRAALNEVLANSPQP